MPTSKCLCESSEDSVLNSSGVKLPSELDMNNLRLPLTQRRIRQTPEQKAEGTCREQPFSVQIVIIEMPFSSGNTPDFARSASTHSSIHPRKELQRPAVVAIAREVTSREEQHVESWQTLYLRFVHTFRSTLFSISSISC